MNVNIGNVAKCNAGKLGIVTHIKQVRVSVDCEGHIVYHGIGFDGKPWQSCSPVYIAKHFNDYIDRTFGRKKDWPE